MNFLAKANKNFREERFHDALSNYKLALSETPEMEDIISSNIEITKKEIEKGKLDLTRNLVQVNDSKNYEGRLDRVNEGLFSGWAVSKSSPDALFNLKVFIDEIFYCEINNEGSRKDLLKHGKSTGLGGYEFKIPSELYSDEEILVNVYWPDGEIFLSFRLSKINKSLFPISNVQSHNNVSIIVPIYNALQDLKECVNRLIKYTDSSVEVILINDASTDIKIQYFLDGIEKENFKIYQNEVNLGFTKTVNRGIKLAESCDVVLLNSDARVTPRWLEGLIFAAYSDQKVATVTPMSDRAGAFSAPKFGNENELPQSISEEHYATSFRRHSLSLFPRVPTGNGFCLYIKRVCIEDVGLLDEIAFPRGYGEENDFCMRARRKGWSHIIDDRTYIFHDRNKSFGDSKSELIKAGRAIVDQRYPEYNKAIEVFRKSEAIHAARFRASIALNKVIAKPKLRGLFVISTLTGGTPQTNADLMHSLREDVDAYLLHCDSKLVSLYKINEDKSKTAIYSINLKEAVDPITHKSDHYDQIVQSFLFEYDFDFVHIRHLAWHSLSLPYLAKLSGAKVIMSFHDYYVLCPSLKLLDNNLNFCSGKCTNTPGDCKPELWKSNSLPLLKNKWVNNWRGLITEALQYCDVFITTHESSKLLIESQLRLNDIPFHVIPHGRDFSNLAKIDLSERKTDKLKILVPGNIGEAKGSKLIEDLVQLPESDFLEFHVLGNSNFSISHSNIILHGPYKRESFRNRVKAIEPDVGAVFSIWNETWCHTLTEIWSIGLPAIVTNYPTLVSRVRESQYGWVMPNQNPSDVLKFLKNVYLQVRKNENMKPIMIENFSSLKANTAKKMGEKYLSVYKELTGAH